MKNNELRIRALPCWKGGIAIEPLRGGLSNESYVVTDGAGATVFPVRADVVHIHRVVVLVYFI